MPDFRQRMTSGIFSTTVILFVFLTLLLGNVLAGYLKQEKVNHFDEKLQIFSTQLISEGQELQLNSQLITEAQEILEGQLHVYNREGALIESSADEMENNTLSSYEIERIINNEGVTYEESEGIHRYTIAIEDEGTLYGFVELQRDGGTETATARIIWIIILTSLGIGLLTLLFIFSKLVNTILNPLKDATTTAQELAKGNFQARTYEFQLENEGNLNHSINILARNLEKMTYSFEIQQDRLETLIDNMGSGVILVNDKGYVELVNRAFKETFKIDTEEWRDQLYYELLPFGEISNLMEDILLMERRTQTQMLIPIQIERKYFNVHGAPIMGNNQEVKGVVLVFHDITELKNLEQMRKDFVANVSHELRTPITSLKGFAETLLDGALENKEVSERFLTIIWKESERLEHIIQDLLELTKIEQQGFELNWEKFELSEVATDVLFLLQSKAEEKNIELHYEKEGQTLIEGDQNRIRQILINVINNSLAYTGRNGQVSVFLTEKKEVVELVVKDNGIGIEKDEIPRIFERFYRVDKARSRNSGGTGLGLAIVKHLVEAHDGAISLESEKHVGTTFRIKFRKEKPLAME